MRRVGLALVLGSVHLASLTGCELLTAPDRSLIPEGGAGGVGGMAGAGGGGTGGGGTGGGGTGGTAGTGGGGTGGMMPQCTTPADCPTPANECETATCEGGVCGVANVAAGTPLAVQIPGNCQLESCDGSGSAGSEADDADLPDDNNDCTLDSCDQGTPTFDDATAGEQCGMGGGTVCDGAGQCVGCVLAADCGADTACVSWSCDAGTCEQTLAPVGTAVPAQTAGDCKEAQCDAAGNVIDVAKSTDLPNDNNDCTSDVCTAGVPSNPPLGSGEACTGGKCDGAGACVQCVADADCGSPTECATPVCTANVCGATFAPSGTPLASQTPNDCKVNQCNGAGGEETVAAPGDLPTGVAECLVPTCTGTTPSLEPKAVDTACSAGFCSAVGTCVECNTGSQCLSGVCAANACAAASCTDGVSNGDETDTDCGGLACPACANDGGCLLDADCTSGFCSPTTSTCTTPACNDGFLNGTESDTDCGGSCGATCSAGQACGIAADCATSVCASNVCQAATCSDTVKNGTETDVDCGGSCVVDCAPGQACGTGADCTSGVCTGGLCQAPSCSDTLQNGTETDVDCGGSCGATCAVGKVCSGAGDCASGACVANLCVTPPQVATVSPDNAATGVALLAPVTVTFNTAMTPATLTAQTAPGACSGSLQVSLDDFASCIGFVSSSPELSLGNTVARLFPRDAFAAATRYKVRVTTGAQSAAGVALASAVTQATGFATSTAAVNECSGTGGLVISQVYGAGSNAGAVFNADYVELHNRGASAVSLNGLSVQYASSGGTTWTAAPLPNVSVPAGGYFLVRTTTPGATGAALTADHVASPTINFSGSAGKVVLMSTTVAIASGTSCPSTNVLDLVGYGGGTNCFEGTGPTPAPSATNAVFRAASACLDEGQNASDFASLAASPRNSSTPAFNCSCAADVANNETNASVEADFCNLQFPASLSLASGATGTVFGRIYEAGVTEAAGAPAGVLADVGYGPAASDPRTQLGWLWNPASFNTQTGNDDEFQGTLLAPLAGSHSYGVRFSLDGGTTYTYCDLNGAGSNAGLSFAPADLAPLTSN
jgi:hypothetical protein